jgi:hypothetical protein
MTLDRYVWRLALRGTWQLIEKRAADRLAPGQQPKPIDIEAEARSEQDRRDVERRLSPIEHARGVTCEERYN